MASERKPTIGRHQYGRWLLCMTAALVAAQSVRAQQSILGSNVIVNGNAEAGPAGTGLTTIVESIPGWTSTGGANVLPFGKRSFAERRKFAVRILAPSADYRLQFVLLGRNFRLYAHRSWSAEKVGDKERPHGIPAAGAAIHRKHPAIDSSLVVAAGFSRGRVSVGFPDRFDEPN